MTEEMVEYRPRCAEFHKLHNQSCGVELIGPIISGVDNCVLDGSNCGKASCIVRCGGVIELGCGGIAGCSDCAESLHVFVFVLEEASNV